MNKVAKFKVEFVFYTDRIGFVLAGKILNGSISIGNTVKFIVNRKVYNRKIIGIEDIRHSNPKKVNVGLRIQIINSDEINEITKLGKNLKIEIDVFNDKKNLQ